MQHGAGISISEYPRTDPAGQRDRGGERKTGRGSNAHASGAKPGTGCGAYGFLDPMGEQENSRDRKEQEQPAGFKNWKRSFRISF